METDSRDLSVDRTAASRGRRPSSKQSMFPPQHGAWAFIVLPIAAGLSIAAWTPLLLCAAIAAIAAFPLSHFLTAVIRYPRKSRFVRPLVLWSLLCLPFALFLVVARPWLLAPGLLYMVAFSINVYFARHHLDRSLANDLVFIAECVALTPIMWAIGQTDQSLVMPVWSQAPPILWAATLTCALALISSTLHVKSLIRERGNPRFRTASRIWALACIPMSIAICLPFGIWGITLVVPFIYLAGRSFLFAEKPRKPGTLGMIELVAFILVFVAVALISATS